MKRLLVFLGVLLLSTGAFAQDYGKSMPEPLKAQALPKKQNVAERYTSLEGTFQIVKETNERVLITEEMLDLVEANRTVSEDVLIEYKEGLDLFIPSKATISSPSFVKLPLEKNKL